MANITSSLTMEAQLNQEMPEKFLILFGTKIPIQRANGDRSTAADAASMGGNASPQLEHHQEPKRASIRHRRAKERILIDATGREHIGGLRNDGFVRHSVTRAARTIMTSLLTEPWLSFFDVPLEVKDIMFSEFKSKYWWNPEIENQVWNAWNSCLARRLSHLYCQGRKNALLRAKTNDLSKTKSFFPPWCNKEVWAMLIDFWCTDEWQRRSRIAVKNRMTRTARAISRNASGSNISFAAQRRMRLERHKKLVSFRRRQQQEMQLQMQMQLQQQMQQQQMQQRQMLQQQIQQQMLQQQTNNGGEGPFLFRGRVGGAVDGGGANNNGRAYGYGGRNANDYLQRLRYYALAARYPGLL